MVQARQMGVAKSRKMPHGTNAAGATKGGKVGHGAGAESGRGQGRESEHFVAIAHPDLPIVVLGRQEPDGDRGSEHLL